MGRAAVSVDHDAWLQVDIILKIVEVLVLPILYGIYRALGKIGEKLAKISEDMATVTEWREQHMILDTERFEAHHERIRRLERFYDKSMQEAD